MLAQRDRRALNSSIRRRSSDTFPASDWTVQLVRPARRTPAILMASGSPAQAASNDEVASGSAFSRSAPTILSSRARASAVSSTSRSTRRPPTRSGIRFRLVTSTPQDTLPGTSGRAWAASRASSSTMRTRRPASRVRYSPARSSSLAGTWSPSTPSWRRNRASTSAGAAGWSLARPAGRRTAARRENGLAAGVRRARRGWSCRGRPRRRSAPPPPPPCRRRLR